MHVEDHAPAGPAGAEKGAIAPQELSGLWRSAPWLRDLGGTAWLLVGITLAVVGAIWVLSLTQTIVAPLIAATVIAAVTSPVVAFLGRHRIRRGAAAAIVLLTLVVLGIAVAGIVVGGISSQLDALGKQVDEAKQTLVGWAHDAGIQRDAADAAQRDASSGVNKAIPALLGGVGSGVKALSSLVFFLSLTALSLFFLLKDGPMIRRWGESHVRVPLPIAHSMGDRILQSLRGYFFGVTLVAIFNAVLVGVGALLLGVPLAGTIAAVTFVGAYIPYLGAWGAGAFSVLIALGGAGSDAAAGMIIIQLLANGILQQMIQPIAYGAALGIHPLAVLVVTIAGGALFGAVGLILAAPLTSAATRIAADLSAARPGNGEVAPQPSG